MTRRTVQHNASVLHIPASDTAERAVLGAVLANSDCFYRVKDRVGGEDFYSEFNRLVFEAFTRLAGDNRDIDLLTTTDQMERSGTLAAAGGVAYVASLADGLPDPANVEHYAAIVRRKAMDRQLLRISQEAMVVVGSGNGNSDAAIAAVKVKLAAILDRDSADGRAVGGPGLLAHLGTCRLSDIPADPPPPLLVGRLDPSGHTILYGTGGTGKGVLACQWIVELARAGQVVLVVDYENHGTEWSRRVRSLGGETAHGAVFYVAPLTPSWKGTRGAIWTQAADIHALVEEIHATYVVIDSIVAACAGVDPLKPEAASLYAGALQFILRPALSLAHITKEGDQTYPFGSVFWHNLARTTWSLAPAGEDGRHSVVLTHRKRNNYGSLGKFLIDVHWDEDLPVKVIERGYTSALAGRIAVELTAGPMTVTELVVNLNDTLDDGAEKVRPNSVGKACRRGTKETPRRFTVTGKGPTARYSNA